MTPEEFKLDNVIGYHLGRTAKEMGELLSRTFAAHGHNISLEQWVVLVHLWEDDGLSQQALADILKRDKSTVARVIHGLERRNWVLRVPSRTDRRIKHIHLTHKGKASRGELISYALEALGLAIEGIPQTEVETCMKVLQKIYTNLKSLPEQH